MLLIASAVAACSKRYHLYLPGWSAATVLDLFSTLVKILPSSVAVGFNRVTPLGPLGFAITLQPIAERIRVEVPGLKINAWYLDDGILCGSPSDLSKALMIIEEDGPPRGLNLNHSKSLLYIHPDSDPSINPLPSDIPVCRDGFNLLWVVL